MSAPTGSSAAASSEGRPAGGAHARGRALVFASTVLWGTSATLARFVFRDRHVPPLSVVELRLLIAVGLLAPWLAWFRPQAMRVARPDWGYFLVLGLFGVAAVQGTYYYAIATLGVGLAILLQYVAPALIVGFEALGGVRLRPATLPVAAAALAGTALLVGGVDRTALVGAPGGWLAGVGSAFAFAFYILYSKRGLRRYAPETVLLYTFLIAGVFWACVTPPHRIVAAGYDAGLWLIFLALGVFSTLVPFACFYAGLRRLPAAQVGIVATPEPVVAVLSAALFLGEALRTLQWLGAALVLLAAAFASAEAPEIVEAQAERG